MGMTDRDIIKAELQNLRNILEDKADMCIGSGKLKLLSFANACSGALELLKEQEPMTVRLTTSTIRCPQCGKQITSRGAIHKEIKFCWKCGQAVKWE